MIHITGNVYLTADPLNITLKQRKIGKKGDSAGQERFDDWGNYGSLQSALDGMVRKKIMLAAADANTFEELLEEEKKIHQEISAFCKKYEKEILKLIKEERERGRTTESDISACE